MHRALCREWHGRLLNDETDLFFGPLLIEKYRCDPPDAITRYIPAPGNTLSPSPLHHVAAVLDRRIAPDVAQRYDVLRHADMPSEEALAAARLLASE